MTYLYHTVTIVADTGRNGLSDQIAGWTGWWVIFPLMMMIFMVLMMSRMFFSRRGGSRSRSGMGPMCMGSMRDMDGHDNGDQTADHSALELLRRRYASGELTDEQFDLMRGKLEER
jgi:uncharacterized membrane protein